MARSQLPAQRLWSIAQAAEYLGVVPLTVRRRIADGSLPALRVGKRNIRIRQEDLEAFLRPIPTTDGGL